MDRPDPNYVAWMEWHESIMSDTHGATKSIVSPRTHKLRLAEEMKRPLTNGKALSPRLRTPRARFGSKAATLLRDASRPPEELTSPSMLSVSSLGASGRAQAAEWPVRPLSGRMLRTRQQQLAPGGMAKNMGAPNSARWMQRASSPDGGEGDSPPSSPLLQTFQFPAADLADRIAANVAAHNARLGRSAASSAIITTGGGTFATVASDDPAHHSDDTLDGSRVLAVDDRFGVAQRAAAPVDVPLHRVPQRV